MVNRMLKHTRKTGDPSKPYDLTELLKRDRFEKGSAAAYELNLRIVERGAEINHEGNEKSGYLIQSLLAEYVMLMDDLQRFTESARKTDKRITPGRHVGIKRKRAAL